MSERTADRGGGFRSDFEFTTLVVIAGMTAVLFAGGISLLGFYEIPPDIDFKPFFIVYAVIALVPWGTPTIAAAVGATLAEGIGDVIEGWAMDDPFGWVGYLIGFTLFGWIVKDDTDSTMRLSVAAIVGAFVQIAIEGLGLLIVEGEAFSVYATVVAGNTVTHGVVMGAVLLIPTLKALQGRVEQFLGPAARTGSRAD